MRLLVALNILAANATPPVTWSPIPRPAISPALNVPASASSIGSEFALWEVTK